jgi:hypothetical protein
MRQNPDVYLHRQARQRREGIITQPHPATAGRRFVAEMEQYAWIAGGCSVASDTSIVMLLRKHRAKE